MIAELAQRIADLNSRIADACARAGRDASSVRVVAVTKTRPASLVQAVIDAGVRDIGENRVQELVQKAGELSGSYALHLIGHLQTNKVAKVLPLVEWIQSIDSVRLVEAIDARGRAGAEPINALVQVNTSGEATKSGCAPADCRALCERVAASPVLRLRGLMTIGPLGGDEKAQRSCFGLLRSLGEKIADIALPPIELSMGMSDDFELAVEEGATIIRVGTLLFGPR